MSAMEEQYRERLRDVVNSWIERNLYKIATIIMAVGSYLGMSEAAETGDAVILLISCLFGLLAFLGLTLWIVDLIRTPCL